MKIAIIITVTLSILSIALFLANFRAVEHAQCGYTTWVKNGESAICRNPTCKEDTKRKDFLRHLAQEGKTILEKRKK